MYEEFQNQGKVERKKYKAILLQTDVELELTIKNYYNKHKDEIDEEKKSQRVSWKHAKLTRDN